MQYGHKLNLVTGKSCLILDVSSSRRPDTETELLLRRRVDDDQDMEVRRTALGLLLARFDREGATKTLLRERALKDPGALDPGALDALGRYYGDDPEIKAFLVARACDDSDEKHRAAALLALSRLVASEQASVLASRDLDGSPPGRDPREPRGGDVIAKAVSRPGQMIEMASSLRGWPRRWRSL